MLEYVLFLVQVSEFLTFFIANQIPNLYLSPDTDFKLTDLLSNKGLVKQRVLGLDGQNVLVHKPKYI